MQLNIIHLPNDPLYPHREEREKSFLKEIEEQDIKDFKVWDGIYDPENTIRAISRAHKQIIRHAKENKLPMVIVAEDDIQFTKLGAWDYFIKSIPKEFDIYLGHIYNGQWDKDGKILTEFASLSLYCVHEKFYDYFLNVSERQHIDIQLNKARRYDFRVCLPMVCRQMNGWSDNAKEIRDWKIKEQDKPMF